MAIEIVPVQADRSPQPDWSGGGALDRVTVDAGRLLGALRGQAVPVALLDALRAAAAENASVDLLLAPDRTTLQAIVDGRRIAIAGAARAAALAVIDSSGAPALARAPASAQPLPVRDQAWAARAAQVDVLVQESRELVDAGTTLAQEMAPGEDVDGIARLRADLGAEYLAQDLARAVETSGIFLEAHVAQWLRGGRAREQIDAEARALAPALAEDAQAPVGDERAARQLAALQSEEIRLGGQAWPGQDFHLAIERDRERRREAANAGDPTGLFVATLTIHLARLGSVQARIRVMDTMVGVQFSTDAAQGLVPDLPELAQALEARGLRLAELTASAPQAGGR